MSIIKAEIHLSNKNNQNIFAEFVYYSIKLDKATDKVIKVLKQPRMNNKNFISCGLFCLFLYNFLLANTQLLSLHSNINLTSKNSFSKLHFFIFYLTTHKKYPFFFETDAKVFLIKLSSTYFPNKEKDFL